MKYLIISFFFVTALSAFGQTLYYSDPMAPDSLIYSVDVPTSSDALHMTVFGGELYGMANSADASVIFGVAPLAPSGDYSEELGALVGTSRAPGDLLFVIDIAAMTFSTVAVTGVSGLTREIAYDAVTNTVYVTDYDNLYTIDPATGVATLIGPMGITNVWAMGFDSANGILYAIDAGSTDTLHSINTTTGAATPIGPVGVDRIADLSFDFATGICYGLGNGDDNIYVINTATGAATLLFPVTGFGLGLAIPANFVRVPALGPLGMTLFALLLMIAGVVFILRRRKQQV